MARPVFPAEGTSPKKSWRPRIGNQKDRGQFKGCAAYADFRELLEKEKDVNAVKIMTPDHSHAAIAIAAMRKGKHVLMHKPLANRLHEARLVVETARQTKGGDSFSAGQRRARGSARSRSGSMAVRLGPCAKSIIGPTGPVWPQYPVIPKDTPPVPEGFRLETLAGAVPGPALPSALHPRGFPRVV